MAVRRVARAVETPAVERPDVEVTYVSIDDLVPWEGNPRANDEAAVELAKLMDEHGFVNPVGSRGCL